MADDPLKYRRDDPPSTTEDHQRVWLTIERMELVWPLLSPAVAVMKNRTALAMVLGLFGWWNWEQIEATLIAMKAVLGGGS